MCSWEELLNCIPNSPYQLHHPLLFLRELTGLAIPPWAFTGLTWAFFPKHNKHYKRRRRKLFCSHLEDELTVMRLELCLFLGRDEFMAWSPGRKPGLVEFWLCYFLEMSLWEVATQLLRFLNMKVKVSHWCLTLFDPLDYIESPKCEKKINGGRKGHSAVGRSLPSLRVVALWVKCVPQVRPLSPAPLSCLASSFPHSAMNWSTWRIVFSETNTALTLSLTSYSQTSSLIFFFLLTRQLSLCVWQIANEDQMLSVWGLKPQFGIHKFHVQGCFRVNLEAQDAEPWVNSSGGCARMEIMMSEEVLVLSQKVEDVVL